MAISNFIPTIWSETLHTELNKNFIAVNHCNRDFEGEIKSKGSVVNICGIGDINIDDYTANTDMTNPQELEDSITKLEINRAKFFNFQIDDVNKAQASPKLMEAAMQKAAEYFLGEHDFAAFCANKKMKKSTVRRIDSITIALQGEELVFTFTGDGFLYNMVRILVGTLLEVGLNQRAADSIPDLFGAARENAGYLVPAQGLCLMEVEY